MKFTREIIASPSTSEIKEIYRKFMHLSLPCKTNIKQPGNIEEVTAETVSLDLPNTSVTEHSHLRQRSISWKRTLYELDCCEGNGSKECCSPVLTE